MSFFKYFRLIYPNELQLKHEHHGFLVSFLDLDTNADFVFNLIKNSKPKAIKFKTSYCFIDDEYNFNDSS